MGNYWSDMGKRSHDWWDGVKEGIRAYAIWRGGDQLVGCMERPIKEVFAEVDEAARKNAQYDPVHRAAIEYMKQTNQLPEDEFLAFRKARRIVKFMDNTALASIYESSRAVDTILEEFDEQTKKEKP